MKNRGGHWKIKIWRLAEKREGEEWKLYLKTAWKLFSKTKLSLKIYIYISIYFWKLVSRVETTAVLGTWVLNPSRHANWTCAWQLRLDAATALRWHLWRQLVRRNRRTSCIKVGRVSVFRSPCPSHRAEFSVLIKKTIKTKIANRFRRNLRL